MDKSILSNYSHSRAAPRLSRTYGLFPFSDGEFWELTQAEAPPRIYGRCHERCQAVSIMLNSAYLVRVTHDPLVCDAANRRPFLPSVLYTSTQRWVVTYWALLNCAMIAEHSVTLCSILQAKQRSYLFDSTLTSKDIDTSTPLRGMCTLPGLQSRLWLQSMANNLAFS